MVEPSAPRRLAVMTSGGDAQGMNPAVRAVVRTALNHGAEIFAIYEGYQGLIDGGDRIRSVSWDDVSSILNLGGTIIGTARSLEFRERDGRRKAVHNLLRNGIDRLIVIGGDGSLSGADRLRQEWPSLVAELLAGGDIDQHTADRHPALMIAGLVGSIDNDMIGTDMTIGADSALHRIVEAIDSIASTAASHQRSFVVEVMGRHCGYLALMSAIAGGADYVFIPENPPDPGWEDHLCGLLRDGRAAGRRNSIVIVAEGAHDSREQPDQQRLRPSGAGGSARRGHPGDHPRARAEGRCAKRFRPVDEFAAGLRRRRGGAGAPPRTASRSWSGMHFNRMSKVPLMESVAQTRRLAELIAAKDYDTALTMRGDSYTEMVHVFHSISHALPNVNRKGKASRIAVVNVGGLAPGMNAAARAAVRLGLQRGHTMLGVYGSLRGLIDGDVRELHWGDVEGWTSRGGAELGISRQVPTVKDLYAIGRGLEQHADRRAADHRRLGCLRGGAHHVRRAGPVPGLPDPDDLPAGHHRQQHAQLGTVRRRGQRAQPDRRLHRPGPAGRHRVPSLFRGRDHGRVLRLPGPARRPLRRCRPGLPARGGHHPQGPVRTTSRRWWTASGSGSGSS